MIILLHCQWVISVIIQADPAGTHWYHSHVGYQRDHGIFGAFIVKPKNDQKVDGEIVMIVGDFYQHPEKVNGEGPESLVIMV